MKILSGRFVAYTFLLTFLSIIYTIFESNTSNSTSFHVNTRSPFYRDIPVGVYIPALGNDNEYLVDEYEQMIEGDVKFVLLFKAWGDLDREFPSDMVRTLSRKNITPIITWEPWKRDFKNSSLPQPEFSLQSIMNGKHDGYIRDWARKSKQSDAQIILRFAHEQSTFPGTKSWYPWQGEPFDYASAYKHIVKIFREEQAYNVKFMWSPINLGVDYVDWYYPGDSFVDYIGLSVLNHGVNIGEVWERWKDCNEIFLPQYTYAQRFHVPIIVSELGSSEIGGDKTKWISSCLSKISKAKGVFGVINVQISSDPTYNNVDWRINSSEAVLGVYKKSLYINEYTR